MHIYRVLRDTSNSTIEVVAPGLANNPTLIVSGCLMPLDGVVTKLMEASAYRVLLQSQISSRASESTPWRGLLTLKGPFSGKCKVHRYELLEPHAGVC